MFWILRLSIAMLCTGMALVVVTVSSAHAQVTTPIPSVLPLACNTNASCLTHPDVEGCTLFTGRYPVCSVVATPSSCSRNTLGYICVGQNANTEPCNRVVRGCQ